MKKKKRGIELSLSPEAIMAMEAKAQALGFKSKSALVEAWAIGQLNDKEFNQGLQEAIALIQELIKNRTQ